MIQPWPRLLATNTALSPAQKQPIANNEQRFGTVSDISENTTQTRGTSMEGMSAKNPTHLHLKQIKMASRQTLR